jgi:hypothetical protein
VLVLGLLGVFVGFAGVVFCGLFVGSCVGWLFLVRVDITLS